MKIYLDNNLGVEKVEQEELTQDTYGYNILKVYIPNAVLAPYDTFTCYYGALLQNGRKVGWFAMEARTNSDADYEANYTLYKATLEQSVVSVEGKVYIGCQVILGNSGNATLIKKNTAVVQFNVRKSVAINNDILILDPEQTTTDVLESYKQLLENALTTYATKAEVQSGFTEVNSKLDLKADKSDTYTKQEVNETAIRIFNYIDEVRATTDTLYNETLVLRSDVDTLQNDVDNLKSVQNVVEVVATYSALQSYDTSKLYVEDKVQVIADETHDGASTIYNWDGSAWQYVGAFGGNSYTKNEVDTKLSTKADKSDTYTKQEVDGTFAMKSDIPTVNNPTITFTQGGTTKGSITLNQSTDQTIALDAGGSGGGSSVVANPTLSGNEATLNGLEVDGTKYKVGGTITLDNIVDKNGNYRFVGGNGTALSVNGMTVVSSKWSLNGSNLMFEILGTFSLSLNADTDLCFFTLPEWIVSKIPTPYLNIVDFIRFDAVYTNRAPATGFIQIYKSEDAIAFKNKDNVTIEALTVFKIRYNIIIDDL